MKRDIWGPFYYIYEPELPKVDEDFEAGINLDDLPEDWFFNKNRSVLLKDND